MSIAPCCLRGPSLLRACLLACVAATPTMAGQQPPANPCEGDIPVGVSSSFATACPKGSTAPSCDRWWHLRQAGVFAARELLATKLARNQCLAGNAVVIAQMDTGVVDDHSFAPYSGRPLDRNSMHLMLRPSAFPESQILTTTPNGDPLPLSYNPGPPNTPACRPSELARQGLTCAARDSAAAAVPRDSFSKGDVLPGFTNSGHGTGTMHVLLQAVPAASVVPYKFAGGIVVTESRNSRLARALTSAAMEDRLAEGTRRRIDVVTMSLGRRSPSNSLEAALTLAEQQGIILVAAAGQWPLHPGTNTRYPAAYPSVIAVTGTGIELTPWTIAGRGTRNLIAAPSKGIWRAGWSGRDSAFAAGNGTSFAAPLVAATAAMWIEYHGGRAELDRRYGRAAVPSLFRYVLARHGSRTPMAVCRDLLTGPSWAAICSRAPDAWDTAAWGNGILAADLVLTAALPTKAELCDEVMTQREAAAYSAICGTSSTLAGEAEDHATLTNRPSIERPARLTPVAGATLYGSGFSRPADWHPSVSLGVVWSGNEIESPHGVVTQATLHRSAQELSVGWAGLFEYAASGSRGKLDVFPMFGPTIGGAALVTAVHERFQQRDRWWVGPKAQLTYYRIRLQVGRLWSVGGAGGSRWETTLGIGF
jgi:hypothetical protein